MIQNPPAGAYLLHHAADTFRVTLTAQNLPPGRAVFRTNLARAAVNRSEIIHQTEDDTPPLARGWHDLAMTPDAPGHWTLQIPLLEEGIFSGKCCFLPDSGEPPIWPQGDNLTIKVAPAHTARGNSIYAAFIRQFGPDAHLPEAPHGGPEPQSTLDRLDQNGYTAIPPSGTFRSFAKALPHIVQTLGFRNILLLPIHPTPTTYARMGRYGSPFASTDFLSVDPALADFDTHATPIEQFTQLVAQVHALGARLLMDLPANHCGWASTLLTHHPEWFKRNPDGSYHSPGAWGVVWEDLVELDYSNPRLCRFMADVFLHWCRKGVDGFRCDAGYMIPEKTWTYIVAKVREKFPETVFLLEGLGGPIQTTDRLLNRSGLDWAYSELFQTYDRAAFERELPQTFHRSTRFGPLVHFAETHDNNRLAAHPGGQTWALLRVRLSALLSQEGAWGITAGVEYFTQQKIDVHGCGGLNWGAKKNMIEPISKLNRLLEMHPSFGPGVNLRMVQQGPGNTLAVLRSGAGRDLLVLANLDPFQPQPVSWDASIPMPPKAWDHIAESWVPLQGNTLELAPGALLCLDPAGAELAREIPDSRRTDLMLQRAGTARRVPWNYPQDLHRVVPVPSDAIVAFSAATPFRVCWRTGADDWCDGGRSVRLPSGDYRLLSRPMGETFRFETVQGSSVELREGALAICQEKVSADALQTIYSGGEIRRNPFLRTVLGNGAGAMAQVRLAWGTLRSQYDALFAANLNRSIPVDRTVFWTRCRGWVQYQGYSSELEAGCLSQVSVDPAGRYAQWDFRVPCGMGLSVGIVLRLALRPLENEARLTVLRRSEAGQEEPTDGVRVVLRPDVEWRSFHTKTKAFEVEGDWSGRVSDGARGFRFGEASLEAVGGLWHREDQWTYGVEHGDDAERGLGGKSDLFSPGWFSFDLKGGESGMVVARAGEVASGGWEEPRDWVREGATLGAFLRAALGLYIVRRDGHKSVIAGYPWFLDWGRDTLIVARGILASGRVGVVKDILAEFGRFESGGRLPNIIHGEQVGNWDTVDAPLWYCRVVAEYAAHEGVKEALGIRCGRRSCGEVVASILRGYRDGTENGIFCDSRSGLVFSPPHFTWMDTNYPAGTPRRGYPVEIQVLWIAALRFAAAHLDASWGDLAARATASFLRLYPKREGGLSDCLFADNPTVGAEDALPDDSVRPNQLFAVTLGLLDDHPDLARGVLAATEPLLLPGAIRSLADAPVRVPLPIWRDGRLLNDPHNPYWPYYSGDEDTRRKPAYHNGTGWGWVFPQWPEALARVDPSAKPFARAILASCLRLLRHDCVCHLAENTDGAAPHWPKGCGAQAWSDSEHLRVWLALGGD